jgi:predicted nucleic acid-binding protein
LILVDTNVLSELSRAEPNLNVLRWARSLPLPLSVSVITVDEIFFGLTYRPKAEIQAWFEVFLDESCQILDIDETIAKRAGALRGQLRAEGRQRTQADMLIAATAQAHQMAIATRNVKDFEGCGVAVVNPFEG